MVKISYPDGSVREFDKGDAELLPIIRHSAAHALAMAVRALYPDAELAIGPATDDGFYYDIDLSAPISPEAFPAIEAKMREIVAAKLPIVREEMTIAAAKKLFAGRKYKLEILSDLATAGEKKASVYCMGEFFDLCRGPHLPTTGYIDMRGVRLDRVAGAYWKGDSKNKMLVRIYGLAFATKAELDAYIARREEAKLRDHRKLGAEMDLFHFEPEYAPGAVFWHPKGLKIIQTVIEYLRRRQEAAGYVEVSTPAIMNKELWVTSGHWDKYHENMYVARVEGEDTEYAVKPMNCPGGILIYKQGIKSYRDLPVRMAEFGTVNRFESSGSLMGLLRSREFMQDDAHIYCAPDQLEGECLKVIKLIMDIYEDFGFKEVRIKLSTRPEKRLGSDEVWDASEKALANALAHGGYEYTIFPGEGAFYGPKLEFTLCDAIGREWQAGTLQLDMNLPGRFDMSYVGQDGAKHTPIMLHRALFGGIYRFIGILLENTAGHLPFWLSPVQVAVANITEESEEYAGRVAAELKAAGIRAEADLSNEKIGYKVRAHSLAKIPYIAAVGRREAEAGSVSVRALGSDKEESIGLADFIRRLKK